MFLWLPFCTKHIKGSVKKGRERRKRKTDNASKCDAERKSKQKAQNIAHFDLNTASGTHYSLLALWKTCGNDGDSRIWEAKLYHRLLSVLILLKTKGFLSYCCYWIIFATATVWSWIIPSWEVLSEMTSNINSITSA